MAPELNDKSPLVKKWQQFLKLQDLLLAEPNDTFGSQTLETIKMAATV